MKLSSGSHDDAPQDAIDTLLAHAPRYAPPAGFTDRVMAALHEEDTTALPLPRQRPLRPHAWASAAAACLTAAFCLLWMQANPALPADDLVVDDALLVDEVLDSIDDPALISAICSVSSGAYSISTGSSAR